MHKKSLLLTLSISLVMPSTRAIGEDKKNGWFSDDLRKADEILDKNIHTASDELNKVIVGAAGTAIAMLKTEIAAGCVALKAQAAVTLTAAKGAAIVAAPWAAGSAIVIVAGYGGYKWYQSSQPSEEKFKTQLQNCLYNNKNGPFNKHSIPEKCTEEYKNFAIWAGDAKAQDKVEAFKKCS